MDSHSNKTKKKSTDLKKKVKKNTMLYKKNKYKDSLTLVYQESAGCSSGHVKMKQAFKHNKIKNSSVRICQTVKKQIPKPSRIDGLFYQIPGLPNYHVVGRDPYVKQIEELFSKCQNVAICGMAGIGKTTLSIYCAKIWQREIEEKNKSLEESSISIHKQQESVKVLDNQRSEETKMKGTSEEKLKEEKAHCSRKRKIEDDQNSLEKGFKKVSLMEERTQDDQIYQEQNKKEDPLNIERTELEANKTKISDYFSNIAFLSAESRTSFIISVKNLADKLNVNKKQPILEILKDIEILYKNHGMLLIIDNLNKLTDINELFELDTKTFYILCTSHDVELDVRFRCIHLDLLTLNQSVFLMLTITNYLTVEKEKGEFEKNRTPFLSKLVELYRAIEGLPLSIAHAAAWIEQKYKRKTGSLLLPKSSDSYIILAEEYLEEFRNLYDTEFCNQYTTSMTKSASLALKLNIDKLESSESKKLLYMLGFLHPDYINLKMFEAMFEKKDLETAVEELTRFSLVCVIYRPCIDLCGDQPNGLQKYIIVHRVVQIFSRSYLAVYETYLAPLLISVLCSIGEKEKSYIINLIEEESKKTKKSLDEILDSCDDIVLESCVDGNFELYNRFCTGLYIFDNLGIDLEGYDDWPIPYKLIFILNCSDKITYLSILDKIFRSFTNHPYISTTEDPFTLQHIAATNTFAGKFELFKFLQEKGVEAHIETYVEGYTPLHILSALTCPFFEEDEVDEAVKQLISLGVDVNSTDFNGSTALHIAAYYGNHYTLRSLLKIPGIQIDLENNDGLTPLFLTSIHPLSPDDNISDDEFLIIDLLEAGAKFDLKFEEDDNLLHRAVKCKYEELIEYILPENCIDVNAGNKDGNTPLHLAVIDGVNTGHWLFLSSILSFFIENGADVQLKNAKNETLMDIAVKANNKCIINILKNPNASIAEIVAD